MNKARTRREPLPVPHCPLPPRQFRHQTDHFQRGQGTIDAFVAEAAMGGILARGGRLATYPTAGAGNGLFERVARKDAKEHGQPVLHTESAQGRAHGPVDVLVVGCLAADDRAETDHRGVSPALGQPAGYGRDFECAGRPGHVDALVGHAVGASVSTAPSSRREVIDSLKRETTMANRPSAAAAMVP